MKYRFVALAVVTLLVRPALFAQENIVHETVVHDSVAQESVPDPFPRPFPHPFAYAGAGLMGGGYAPLAWEGGGGLMIDTRHFLASAEGSYDNGHKINDNDQPNPKGHDRSLAATASFRLSSGWFAGAGVRWSQLSTTNYSKGQWRPTFGGGKDYFHRKCAVEDCVSDFSMRVRVDYVLPGTDHFNGVQGPLLSIYMPSPAAKGHVFFRQTLGIYEFHETVTAPSNLILTRQQMGDRSVTSFGELTLMYRF